MKFLTSGFSFVIQAILVVAAVLVFAYFDPFGIFVSTRLKLKDTPSHIRQVRAIGELITAEYYGEVISSYQSIIYIQKEEEITRTKSKLAGMDSSFINRLAGISAIDDKKQRKEQFEKALEEFKQNDNFDDYLHAIKKKLNLSFLNSLFNKLLDNENISILQKNKDYLKQLQSDQEQEIVKIYSKRAVRKPQLILLGRGKVQAGFRFDKLDARNMVVDTLRNRIILYGIQPEILSCDINPWLIPELGIRGFEIIAVNGKADNPAILYKVKKACLDSLRANALASDILNIARTNAEQNLQTFFSLLLDEPRIEVRIETDLLSYYLKYLRTDSVVNPSELESITRAIAAVVNPPYNRHTSAYDSARAFALLDTLKHCRLATGAYVSGLTPFSYPIYEHLMNKKINRKNRDSILTVLKAWKDSIQGDPEVYSRWFYQPGEGNYAIQPVILKGYLRQSDSLFYRIFGNLYPDTLKTKGKH
ncbi:MAG: DUF4230 domain-containing protein [Bacteroidota bacterium]